MTKQEQETLDLYKELTQVWKNRALGAQSALEFLEKLTKKDRQTKYQGIELP